jgi:hypothetical protein
MHREKTMMKSNPFIPALCLLAAMVILVGGVSAATKAEPEVPLTEAGEELLAHYSDRLTALRAKRIWL